MDINYKLRSENLLEETEEVKLFEDKNLLKLTSVEPALKQEWKPMIRKRERMLLNNLRGWVILKGLYRYL